MESDNLAYLEKHIKTAKEHHYRKILFVIPICKFMDPKMLLILTEKNTWNVLDIHMTR